MKMPSTSTLPDRRPRDEAARLPLQVIETEVLVHAPCAAVHAFATNPSRWHLWHPATHSTEPLPDQPLGLGGTVVEHIATAGRRFSATWTVAAVQVPQCWVIVTDTPQGLARITYRLAALRLPGAAEATRFRRTLEFSSRPRLLRLLDPLIATWVLGPQSRRALDNLKRVVEAG